jgi:hypothetical protein
MDDTSFAPTGARRAPASPLGAKAEPALVSRIVLASDKRRKRVVRKAKPPQDS